MKKIGMIFGAAILFVAVIFGWWIFSRPERGTTGEYWENTGWWLSRTANQRAVGEGGFVQAHDFK
jgi:hypothetical protein